MYVRLAFAVAAHLEPEILIVDEVLAVGDAQFQKKCLGKMQDVSKGGRTVLFVSHNMAAVKGLCTRAILMQSGQLMMDGQIDGVIAEYLRAGNSTGKVSWTEKPPQADGLKLLSACVRNSPGGGEGHVACEDPFEIAVRFTSERPLKDVRAGFIIKTAEGVVVCGSADAEVAATENLPSGEVESVVRFTENPLNAGMYYVQFGLSVAPHTSPSILTDFDLCFEIEDTTGFGAERSKQPGLFRPKLTWARRR